ncbi:MAG: Serine dehydrogenase proteinase [Candidatus Methanofastidiosum methylothiophilum]|uniref:Serine dehydrogenase proteinase n=1 Tax=Candidatus Methanofastidiosum methylothiophilum TaxID=1705564 RepID=A0A150IT99_9EURY|nr:MAG: Serine dehydrogenase proteinase [Candidatus Methanofastidiosum methylthiophilus]
MNESQKIIAKNKVFEDLKEKISANIKNKEKIVSEKINKLEEMRERRCYPLLFDPETPIDSKLVGKVFYDLRKNFKDCDGTLDVLICSTGGEPDAAYNLAMLFRKYGSKDLNFIVPRMAKSAATILACASDKILMTPIAELGPLDVQIFRLEFKSDGIEPTVFSPMHVELTLDMIRKEYNEGNEALAKALLERIQSPILLSSFIKANEISEQYTTKLLNTRMLKDQKDKVSDISKQLTRGYAHHGFCINIEEARELGLVVEEIPDDQIDLINEIQMTKDKISELKSRAANLKSDEDNPEAFVLDLVKDGLEELLEN